MVVERNAWGFSLFADDIRQEVSNKYSLMGIYHGEVVIKQPPPVNLARFVVYANYFEVRGKFRGDLTLKVFCPGDKPDAPTAENTITRTIVDSIPEPADTSDPSSERLVAVAGPVVFSPLTLRETGYISVEMHCDGVRTRLGRVLIRLPREGEEVQFPLA